MRGRLAAHSVPNPLISQDQKVSELALPIIKVISFPSGAPLFRLFSEGGIN